MNLPFLKKKEKIEYFLALLLREEKVSAVIFEEVSGKVKIIGKHEAYFETSIEEAPFDEWLDVLDKAISTAESALPNNIETQKTVFGVNENWVEGAKIKKDYLIKLKKVSDALGLSPIGFLVIHEAIARLIQEEEGVPVSAILTEVGKKGIAVSLIRAGKISVTKRAKIEGSIPETTDKILNYFVNHEILPSRIIIFDDKDLEKLSQEFIGHTWSKSLPFLHVPQITNLAHGFDAKAILFGAAVQMGFEMLNEEDLKPQKDISDFALNKKEESATPVLATEEIKSPEIEEEKQEIPYEDFGFVIGDDVALVKEETISTEEDLITKRETFEINKETVDEEKDFAVPDEEIRKTSKKLKKNNIKKAINIISNMFFRIFKLSSILSPKKALFVIPIILFIIAIPLLYFFGVKSTVLIDVKPKVVDKNQDIIFSIDTASDFSKNIISSEKANVSEDGTLSIQTTGKKEVGDKAKGNVTIYSRLTEEKTLSSGTVITSSNDLQFVLDNNVKLASSSADASAQPTTAKASVTAKDIGKESNLPSNAKLTFGSISATDLIAKNETAFSGGTKKEINIVSKADQDKLIAKLPKDLEEKAKNDLNKNISDDKALLPVFTKTEFTKKEFNKKIGDEASTLTLNATVSFLAISYKKDILNDFSKNIFKDEKKDLILSKEDIKYDVENIKQKNEKEIAATIKVKAPFIPKIDIKKIQSEISGKSFDSATDIIIKIPQVSDINISLKPNLPFLPKTLPRIPQNITIVVNNNE